MRSSPSSQSIYRRKLLLSVKGRLRGREPAWQPPSSEPRFFRPSSPRSSPSKAQWGRGKTPHLMNGFNCLGLRKLLVVCAAQSMFSRRQLRDADAILAKKGPSTTKGDEADLAGGGNACSPVTEPSYVLILEVTPRLRLATRQTCTLPPGRARWPVVWWTDLVKVFHVDSSIL